MKAQADTADLTPLTCNSEALAFDPACGSFVCGTNGMLLREAVFACPRAPSPFPPFPDMSHDLAGQPIPPRRVADVPQIVAAYYTLPPDPGEPGQRVSFGTSGHRGRATERAFNEDHIAAIAQALVEHRREAGIGGPLLVGVDTHALSEAAFRTALEVFAANGVEVRVQQEDGEHGRAYTPTPALSRAIIRHNRERDVNGPQADGVIITPSHNPPADGGFKYNPPHGGPAGSGVTDGIEARANELLESGLGGVDRVPFAQALSAETTQETDFMHPYIDDLDRAIDMEAIREAGISIGVDPMGGAAVHYWRPIADAYGLDLTVTNERVDPAFAFMPPDTDGQIRMDCSSADAMARLVELSDRFDIAFGNDPDGDRHGIVTPTGGLMNPNHYLSVAVDYLFQDRTEWPAEAAVGKTLVTSSMIDRVAARLGQPLAEVPVGFKWFVDGLGSTEYGFGGEESAGASLLEKDGRTWTTDKDGIVFGLLAAEITAKTGRDPAAHYADLESEFGRPVYARTNAPASPAQKEALRELSPDMVEAGELAGEPIEDTFTRAPGNDAPIGGLKVVTANGWFAARPSGTEAIYKIYAESFKGEEHVEALKEEAQALVEAAFEAAGVASSS